MRVGVGGMHGSGGHVTLPTAPRSLQGEDKAGTSGLEACVPGGCPSHLKKLMRRRAAVKRNYAIISRACEQEATNITTAPIHPT